MPRARNLFIAVFLAAQLALPLCYYAGGDRYDERFAWRMFSPERMVQCSVAFERDGQPVRLHTAFHTAWINLARRGRRDVIDGMIRALCKDGDDLRLVMTCAGGGEPPDKVSSGGSNLCDWGRLP